MPDDLTVPIHSNTTSVRAIVLEVVSGPDAGSVSEPSTDSVSVGTAEGNDVVLHDPTVSRSV